jgi:lipopolysaccharide export system protein LptA
MSMRKSGNLLTASAIVLVLAAATAAAQTSQRPANSPAGAAQNKPAQNEPARREAGAPAQTNQGPPNALQGFSQNRDKPVQIEAATLEVRDKQKMATFSGNVHLIQGDTDMRCKTLDVYYDDDSAQPGVKTAQPGPAGQQQIKKLEAKGGVVVTQKEHTATGQRGIFDMKENTVTLLGNVVMTQGQNVLKGERLTVNLTTGVSRVDNPEKGGQGRVQGMFYQSSSSSSPAAPPNGGKDPQATPAKDPPKPAPGRPLRLN